MKGLLMQYENLTETISLLNQVIYLLLPLVAVFLIYFLLNSVTTYIYKKSENKDIYEETDAGKEDI